MVRRVLAVADFFYFFLAHLAVADGRDASAAAAKLSSGYLLNWADQRVKKFEAQGILQKPTTTQKGIYGSPHESRNRAVGGEAAHVLASAGPPVRCGSAGARGWRGSAIDFDV